MKWLSHMRTTLYNYGHGMCVSPKHGLVIISDFNTRQLRIFLLVDGSLVRTIGSFGKGKGQFDFNMGGLCITPDGDSVLVAEARNRRVQEVRLFGAGCPHPWIRFVGERVLEKPEYVDCNNKVIVVSESECQRISVLSWGAGDLVSQFGSFGSGSGQLNYPQGVRLLVAASSLIVADSRNNRLCLFSLRGEFVQAIGSEQQGLNAPCDVLESIDGFIVANCSSRNIVKLSSDGEPVDLFGGTAVPDGEFDKFGDLCALAAVPGGGLVVRNRFGTQLHVFRWFDLRVEWITACVSLARGSGSGGSAL